MPILYGQGVEGQFDYLVINLLGSSLDNLYRQSSKKVMDLRSVCCIAMQVVSTNAPSHESALAHYVRCRSGGWRPCTTEEYCTATYNWATA